jgi:Zn-finger protein
MAFLKRWFCQHSYVFVRNIYGDEIIEKGWKRSIWRCQNCGKTHWDDVLVRDH